ncbi:MAG: tRNA (adenosine(37)-N6)-threonylcarbamoyltransferase complex transferase subunit TsaD [Patescibacteria group bacterium]
MIILSIESSCDETGISVLKATGKIEDANFEVLSNHLASQVEAHIPYGGVYPMLAKQEHIKNLPILFEKVLKDLENCQVSLTYPSTGSPTYPGNFPIDAIAVTYGPGLPPALWAGITFAQDLAKKWGVPLIPVNHMEGHIFSVFGKHEGKFKIPKIEFPALALLVSGAHTELVLIKNKNWKKYEILGETLDDAVGEAFDKVARMLGLEYPGGPKISKLAEEQRKIQASMEVRPPYFKLPRPMMHTKDFNFSFSGLKTAVLYLIQKIESPSLTPQKDKKLDEEIKRKIACEFENAAIEVLIHKTKKAIDKYKIKSILVGGGVSANQHLRDELSLAVEPPSGNLGAGHPSKLYFPPKELTGDNSLMIGIAAYFRYLKNMKKYSTFNQSIISKIKAEGKLRLK